MWGLGKKDPNLVPSSCAEGICSPNRMLLARPGLRDGQRAGSLGSGAPTDGKHKPGGRGRLGCEHLLNEGRRGRVIQID